jgi:hypothetical protein
MGVRSPLSLHPWTEGRKSIHVRRHVVPRKTQRSQHEIKLMELDVHSSLYRTLSRLACAVRAGSRVPTMPRW